MPASQIPEVLGRERIDEAAVQERIGRAGSANRSAAEPDVDWSSKEAVDKMEREAKIANAEREIGGVLTEEERRKITGPQVGDVDSLEVSDVENHSGSPRPA